MIDCPVYFSLRGFSLQGEIRPSRRSLRKVLWQTPSSAQVRLTENTPSGSHLGRDSIIAVVLYVGECICKNTLSGFVLYYMFGVFRYAARHALPVKKSLPLYAGHLNNTSNKLDPLAISESVEVAIELRCLNMFNIIVCHTDSVVEVVLLGSL